MENNSSAIDISIPYYTLLETLGNSLNSTVYKAASKKRPDNFYVVKILKRTINNENLLRYLVQKVERLKIIHDPRVLTPTDFEYSSEIQFITRSYFPGQTLNQFIQQYPNGIPLKIFFHIAGELVLAINAIHEAGIIHGSIKPNNILIQADTHTIRIIDFLNPVDIQEISHFIYDRSFVEGTLAYTSPEQTGRINHRVEFSTDIYSLGITFYQLLTGHLPFSTADPLELIHSHLAEQALTVDKINADIPLMVSKIVTKMCLKEPEKRYQTGMGLYADIHQCQTEYKRNKRIAEFNLGIHDYTHRVIFISKMVGRKQEAQCVLDEYAQVTSAEQFHAVFISGLPGIGKTRLIQELQRPLVEHKGYFTSGKFDQYQKNIPYSSLIQALRNLIRTFLTESDARVACWRNDIQKALGQKGKVITDVIPELTILIGPQPDVATLPPVEARNRFNNVFSAFLASLSREENPLILFIDDLQWCDTATFDFLKQLFINAQDFPNLLFIGAYRHNEVDKAHPLSFLLKEIKQRKQAIRELRITALDKQACHEMVAYILDLPMQQTRHLADFLSELTEGNPLFVSESLSWLHNEQLMLFSEQGQWTWDMDKIRQSQMPQTVVDMFGSKVKKLPDETLEIVKICACMGNRFSVEDIALIHEIELSDLFELLKAVMTLGLLIESKTEFQFVHDRVQEAVLRLIPQDRRKQIHWKVGWHLLKDWEIDESLEGKESLFTIAAHLNLGSTENISHANRIKLARINLYAGNKALNALATQAANEYFSDGLTLLAEQDWENEYALVYRLHQKLAKTELMCGRYEKSEALLNELLKRAADDMDRAEALAEQTTSLSSIGNFIKAIETANKGLAFFDKAIPDDEHLASERTNVLMQKIDDEYENVWDSILNMPFTEERRSKIELVFYSELIPDLYMSGLVPQLYLSAAQSTIHSLQGGMDESVIYSFSIMGLNLGEQGEFEKAYRYQDLAHDLCEKYPDTFGATRGINGIVWCNMHSRSHPREIVEYCRKGIQCGKNCGDLYNAGLSYGPLMWNLQVQGNDFNEIQQTAEECLNFSQKNQLSFSVGLAEAVQAGWIAPMKNPQEKAIPMAEKLQLWESRNHVASAGSYFVLLGVSHYYLGRYQQAFECLKKVQRFLSGMTDNVLKRQWYAFRILSSLRYNGKSAIDKKELEEQLNPLLRQLQIWAELGPLLKPYLALCLAEWQRVFHDSPSTSLLYMQAIEQARAQNYLFLDGFINELFAEWLQQQGWVSYKQYLHTALHNYRKFHYKAKEIQIQESYPQVFQKKQAVINHPTVSTPENFTLPDIDIDYLIKSSLALSAEIKQPQLLSKIMSVVLECSGAQFGYLIQHQQDKWLCMSESHIEKSTNSPQLPEEIEVIDNICYGIVHYVSRTHENIVLADAQASQEFANLPEISQLGIRSLMCMAIMRQSKLIGILYLENRLSPHIFTPERVHMINLLSSQMAISIENARLIQEVWEINADLEQRVQNISEKNREKDHIMIQQSKLATMGEMINNIAHQWRQPLNALGLLFGNLQDAQTYNELTAEYLNEQINNGFKYIDRMSHTIDDFRDFFSPNKPREVFSVGKAVEDAVELVCASFGNHSVHITIDIDEDLNLYGAQNEYAQVLLNLITNAKEAILSRQQSGEIKLKLTTEHGKALLSIEDNGGGIPDEILAHIFKPYYSTKEGGTGIGLYMSKMILETSLNGCIEICNVDNGAKFTIITPVLAENPDYRKLIEGDKRSAAQ